MARSSKAQNVTSVSADSRHTTAMLVINTHSGLVLCPFFAKCDGVLLIDQKNTSTEFHQNNRLDAQSLCDLIVALKPGALVCALSVKPKNAGCAVRGSMFVLAPAAALSTSWLPDFRNCHELEKLCCSES
jgi:hypothetical protein